MTKTYKLGASNFILLERGSGMKMLENAVVLENNGMLDVEAMERLISEDLGGVVGHAQVSASAKKICAIECYGSMELSSRASISASSEGEGVDLLCYGAIVNYGSIDGELEAISGVIDK